MIFEHPELWFAAANGCTDAQRLVSINAREAAISGKVPRSEGLIVAETMARLATAADTADKYAWLACVLYLRGSDARDEGDSDAAHVFEVEATALLTLAADMGDPDSLQALANLGDSLEPATINIVGANQPLIFTITSPAGSA